MELDERPTEQYSDVGGLDTQIQEVVFCILDFMFTIFKCRPVSFLW